MRQRPQGVYYLKVYFLVLFPASKARLPAGRQVGNPSGKILDASLRESRSDRTSPEPYGTGQAGMTEIWNCGRDHRV